MSAAESTDQSGANDTKYDVLWAQIRETSRKVDEYEAEACL